MEWTLLKVLAYIVGTSIVVVNLLFCVIGIKTFSRKMHSFLVLCLGVGDGVHGIAVLCLVESFLDNRNIEHRPDINIPLCISQLILYFVSLAFSLTVLLFISVERYVTVKNFNFLKVGLTLRKKYICIGTFIALIWTYICICVLTAPIKHTQIRRCSVGSLYNEDTLDVNGWAIICLLIILIFTNLMLYGKTTRIVWKLFSKSAVLSFNRKDNKSNPRDRSYTVPDLKDPIHEPTILLSRQGSLWNIPKARLLQNKVAFKNVVNPENPGPSGIMGKIEERVSQQPQLTVAQNGRTRKISTIFNPWERRALITNCYLIVDHVVLFLPFICLLVADRLKADIPHEAWVFGTFWLMIHFLANPFIFAWRIRDIHTEIKRMIRCTSQVEPQAKFSLSKRTSRKYSTKDFSRKI